MTAGVHYTAGNVTVTNGSPAVVGVGTSFVKWGITEGDWLNSAGLVGYVASVTDNTNLVLQQTWKGSTVAGASYLLERRGGSVAVIENQVKIETMLDKINELIKGYGAGLHFTYSDTVAMADPGLGKIRFNDLTIGSVTAIAIDDTTNDSGNPDISAFINAWDDSTNTIKGHLIIRESDEENIHIFNITALTNNSGWTQLTVAYVAGSGTWSDTDNLNVEFCRAGDAGAGDFMADGSVAMTGDFNAGNKGIINVESINSGPLTELRNKLINGCLRIWQEAISFNPVKDIASFVADRYYIYQVGGTTGDLTVSKQIDGADSMIRIAVNTATAARFVQIIKTADVAGLEGGDVTLSFEARYLSSWASPAGTVFKMVSGTGSDEGSTLLETGAWAGITNYASDLTGLSASFQKFKVTGALASSVRELAFKIDFDAADVATGNNLEIKNIQIEKGPTATVFARRPAGLERFLCRLFYQEVQKALGDIFLNTGAVANADLIDTIFFYTPMNAVPTLLTSGVAGDYSVASGAGAGGGACTAVPQMFNATADGSAYLRFSKTTHGLTVNTLARFIGSTAGFLKLRAES